jgi:hypothetical protein
MLQSLLRKTYPKPSRLHIERLSSDEIILVLSYLSMHEIFNCCITNKEWSNYLNNDSYLWKTIALSFNENYNVDYKQVAKDEIESTFNTGVTDRFVEFSNKNRTMSIAKNHWYTVQTKKKILDNSVYSWNVRIDQYKSGRTRLELLIGLQDEKHFFKSQDYVSNLIIGYNTTGCAFCLGTYLVYHNGNVIAQVEPMHLKFQVNDILKFTVDTRSPSFSLKNALFKLEHNGILLFEVTTIDLTSESYYYPTISIEGTKQITLLR